MSKLHRCSVCYHNNTDWMHTCGYYVCNVCIQIWALTRITSDKLKGQESIPCLHQKCKGDILFSEIQECLNFEQMDKVYKAYNDNYISDTRDIVRCPRPGCDFAGIIVTDGCKQQFMCPSCGYIWRDHSQISRSEIAMKSFSNLIDMNPESFNYLNKLLFSQSCPNCGMTISKGEGCSHMLCQQCFYEFCWDCLGHYPGYVHQPGAICGLRKLILKSLIFIPLLILYFNVIFTNSFAMLLSKICLIFIGKVFLASLNLITGLISIKTLSSCISLLKVSKYIPWIRTSCAIYAIYFITAFSLKEHSLSSSYKETKICLIYFRDLKMDF